MDETPPAPHVPSTRTGGTLEPVGEPPAGRSARPSTGTPGVRYELHDPFAEVTYRLDRFDEMTVKADQLGAVRFMAVDTDGKHVAVTKVRGRWHEPQVDRPRPPPAANLRLVADATPTREEARLDSAPKPSVSDPSAERATWRAQIEAALSERYVIKRPALSAGENTLGQTEYRFRGDLSRIAFTESTFRLATDTNSPSVARSMVDLAQARNWQALKVSGSEEFRRMVWLEAAARGIKSVGYEPLPADLQALQTTRDARLMNRVEPTTATAPVDAATKASGRGGGRKAVLAAIDAILLANGVAPARRDAVLTAAAEQLASRVRSGRTPRVKVRDIRVPSQSPTVNRAPDTRNRAPDRSSPTR